jgi:hypothetical protein
MDVNGVYRACIHVVTYNRRHKRNVANQKKVQAKEASDEFPKSCHKNLSIALLASLLSLAGSISAGPQSGQVNRELKMNVRLDSTEVGESKVPKGSPRRVFDHDFRTDSIGVAIPYGIYDITENRRAFIVGVSHDALSTCRLKVRKQNLSWKSRRMLPGPLTTF